MRSQFTVIQQEGFLKLSILFITQSIIYNKWRHNAIAHAWDFTVNWLITEFTLM